MTSEAIGLLSEDEKKQEEEVEEETRMMEQEKQHPEDSSDDDATDDDTPVVLTSSKENDYISSSSTETTSALEDSSSSSSLTCNTSLSPTTITLSSPSSHDGDHHHGDTDMTTLLLVENTTASVFVNTIVNQEDESNDDDEEEKKHKDDDCGEGDDDQKMMLSQLLLPPPNVVVEEYKKRYIEQQPHELVTSNEEVEERCLEDCNGNDLHSCPDMRTIGVEIHKLKNFRRDKPTALDAMENLILWMSSIRMNKIDHKSNCRIVNHTPDDIPVQRHLQQHFIVLAIPHVLDLIEDNMSDMDCVERGLDFLYKGVVVADAVDDDDDSDPNIHKTMFVSSISLSSHGGGSIGWLLRVMKQRRHRFNVSDNNFQCWMILGRIAEAKDSCIIDDDELIKENLTEMFLSRLSLRYWDSIQCWAMRQLLLRDDLPCLRKQFYGEEGVLKYVRDEQSGSKSFVPIFIFIRSLLNDPNFPSTTLCDNDDMDKVSLVDWVVYATIEIMRNKDESANCQHEGMEILEALLQMAGSGDPNSSTCMLVQVRSAMIKAKAIRVLGNIFDSYKEDEKFKLNERAHKLIKPLL